MRAARLKVSEVTGVYHCISRTVAGERLLGEVEREVLRKTLWRVAAFCGVEVLSYCILSNHFHVLVRVQGKDDAALTRAEILRRYRILYGGGRAGYFPEPEVMETLLKDENCPEAARWEARLRARMNDVSEFMKTLKQRFTTWHNRTHGRFGTLWAERFKSTIVENSPETLRILAAYIDLNPVRAGLVEDPGDYRWSSYGEALSGRACAQVGLAAVFGQAKWAAAAADYRLLLFGKGANGRIGEQCIIPREKVAAVLAQGGEVPLASLLRCRIRFFSDGAVLGSKAFVLEMEARMLQPAGRRRRRLGAVLPSSEGSKLMAMRSQRAAPIG